MDTKTIINHLQDEAIRKEQSLQYMDMRHRIPRRIAKEIKKLKAMIDYLNAGEK